MWIVFIYVCFVSFCVLFLCTCVLYYCHRVTTQLQLTNISILTQHWVEYSFRQLLHAYYIMQMHYVSLLVHTVGYAEHVWTTALEMDSASWQLAWRKGCDVTLKPKDCQLTCFTLAPFFNTQVTLLLRAPSWNVWGEEGKQNSFFGHKITKWNTSVVMRICSDTHRRHSIVWSD